MEPDLLAANGIWYRYPGRSDATLVDVSFQVARKTLTLVLGSSGSGKSTMFALFAGLLPIESDNCGGSITTFGAEHAVAPGFHGAEVGLLLQEPARQLHQLTVRDELRSPSVYRGLPWDECERRAAVAAEMFLTQDVRDARTEELSIGQQQLVALAALWAANFEIIFLDEPFSYLDGAAARALVKTLDNLRTAGKTLIVSGHDLTYLAPHADQAMLIADGSIRVHDAARAVFYDRAVADAIGEPAPIAVARSAGVAATHPVNWDEVAELIAAPSLPLMEETRPDTSVLSFDKVTVRRGTRTVLQNVTFDVRAGEATAVVGANGSGKTTLLRATLGQLKCSGEIRIEGKDLSSIPSNRLAATVAWVPQKPGDVLFEWTVADEVNFGPVMLGAPLTPSRIETLLQSVGLGGKSSVHPRTLSAGQQRLLTIAISLANEPPLLLLDEPEFGLDQNTYRGIALILRNLIRGGMAALVVTHNLEVAFSLCSRLIILAGETVAWEGSTRCAASSIPPQLAEIAFPQRGLQLLAAVAVTKYGGLPHA